jgi:phosphoribosylformylglycinamidine (FGAM) synthase-like enzyme
MSQITPEVVQAHQITPDEYERIVSILGRQPNITELGIFSANTVPIRVRGFT